MSDVERVALSIHEAELGEPCKARGAERAKHIAAYQEVAVRWVQHFGPVPVDHTMDGWCWCQPTTIEVPPNGEIIVHRRMWDAPDD